MFALSQCNDVIVIEVHGNLDARNIDQFDGLLTSTLKNQTKKVVLDLSGLRHLHYRLVPHLMDRIVELQCAGGDLKLAAGSHYIHNILTAMGCEEDFYPTVVDAVLSFTPPEEQWQ